MTLYSENIGIENITKLMPSAADGSRRTSLSVSNTVHGVKRRLRRTDAYAGIHTPPVQLPAPRQRNQDSGCNPHIPQTTDLLLTPADAEEETEEQVEADDQGSLQEEIDEDESSNFALGDHFPILNPRHAFTWADHIEPAFWPCSP
jgi:hypothetical protein